LAELASRMKTRIASRVEPALAAADENVAASTPISGVAVIATNTNLQQQAEWLLRNGAAELLVLPSQAAPPQRVLIHWADDNARRSTLAVAASLLRHVPAEAVYLGILPGGSDDAQRPLGVRTLLDARSEAQAVHGLEMRTELHFGAAAEALQRQLTESGDQMLILGISHLQQLKEQFGALLASPVPYSLMIVYRPTKEADVVARFEPVREPGGIGERAALS
jgi:hypothetical protein